MVERSLGVGEATGSIPVSPTPAAANSLMDPGYSSIGRALGSGPRGSQFKPEYPDHFFARTDGRFNIESGRGPSQLTPVETKA